MVFRPFLAAPAFFFLPSTFLAPVLCITSSAQCIPPRSAKSQAKLHPISSKFNANLRKGYTLQAIDSMRPNHLNLWSCFSSNAHPHPPIIISILSQDTNKSNQEVICIPEERPLRSEAANLSKTKMISLEQGIELRKSGRS